MSIKDKKNNLLNVLHVVNKILRVASLSALTFSLSVAVFSVGYSGYLYLDSEGVFIPNSEITEMADTEDPDYVFIVDEEVALAGPKVQKDFEKNGWSVVRSDSEYIECSNLKSAYDDYVDRIVGLTSRKKKTITLTSDNSIVHETFIHELGHAVDFDFGDLSQTKKFKKIFNEEKDNFVNVKDQDGYPTVNEREYFACAFASIVLGYDDIALKKCPKTKKYIESYIY